MPEPNLDRWAREVVEQSRGSLWTGLGLTLVFHVLAQVAIQLLIGAIVSDEMNMDIRLLPLVWLGLIQLVYMIPAILIFRRSGDSETAKGLIVGASLTLLLQATCSGLFFLND